MNKNIARLILTFSATTAALLLPCLSLRAALPTNGTVTPATIIPVTWAGTAIGTGGTDETSAIEGTNRDTFILTVAPGIYTGKLVAVKISWTLPADDYDLYIHKRNADGSDGALVSSSANGAPTTSESATINPSVDGTGDFNIIAVYFVNPPGSDQPQGSVTVISAPATRTATYISGGITFAPNSPVKAQTASSDGEPSSRVDVFGNYYVCGIRGVPAGVDLWYFDLRPTIGASSNPTFDPNMRVPTYRGQPDSTTSTNGQNQLSAGALGGGDIDLAVGFGAYTGVGSTGEPSLAYASLTAANNTIGRSLDHGATFTFNPIGNFAGGVPVNDREWMGFIGNNKVYLEYRNFVQGVAFIQQSTDGGLTYGPAVVVGTIAQTGSLDVDQGDGTVYISGNDGQLAVGIPDPILGYPTTYTLHQPIPATTDAANIFVAMRVASDHTVYLCYSNGTDIYVLSSADKGVTWTPPVAVNNPTDPATVVNLLPWIATGPTSGSIGVAWYGTDNQGNTDDSRWRVYFAQSFDANATSPTFRIVQASDHSNHASNISLKGLPLTGIAPNRNLIDYFQINFDPQGAAVIGYTDDHNDFNGHTYVARQITGPSINGGNLPAVVEGSGLPAQPFAIPGATPPPGGGVTPQAMQPGPKGEQITDFAYDQDSGLLLVTPAPSSVDIISIKYLSQDSNQGPIITANMKVSDLTAVPPSGSWKMYFTANAPELGVVNISGNSYSKGLSDDGDQFFVQATTSASGTRSYKYGTTIRNFDGSTTDTVVGNADRGFFNQQNKTITVRISSAKINAILTGAGHPTIGFGSTLCGLRGQTSVVSTVSLEDFTRGGTEFTITNPF
ncbi:MAG: exo-alpha-sialidase [Chthoniobacterales bacterium]|nr:exo-alpha-sialidase [Chthoniobacterales bacterium]